jgi:hypothetical protein
MTGTARIARGTLAALVLGALGFGSAQLLAATPLPDSARATCNALQCLDECGPEWICISGRCHCGG